MHYFFSEPFEIKWQHITSHPKSLSMHLPSTRIFSPIITEAVNKVRKFTTDTILLSSYKLVANFTNLIRVFKHLTQSPTKGS